MKPVCKALACLLAVVLFSGTACHAQKTTADNNTASFEKKVDIGGRSHFISCTAAVKGKPTALFEAGMNNMSATWDNIRPDIAKFARACVYDRAGLGKSDPSGRSKMTAANVVDDLELLLTKSNITGPYVLVGHSFGGLAVRLFAARHPSDVKGIVLVDAVHEDETERWLKVIPPEIRQRMEAGGAMMPMGGEPLDLPESDRQMRAAKWRTDVPVIVLARGSRSFSVNNFPPALREYAPQGEALRLEMQRDLAARSSRGKLIMAEKSGHFIHHDEPALVIGAIKEVLNSIGRK